MTALGHFQPPSISRKLPFEWPLLGGKAIAWEIASSLGMVLRAQLVDGVDENTEVIRIFTRNSRFPEMLAGDLKAIMAACRLGAADSGTWSSGLYHRRRDDHVDAGPAVVSARAGDLRRPWHPVGLSVSQHI